MADVCARSTSSAGPWLSSRAMARASWYHRSGVSPLRRLALISSAADLNSLAAARNSAQSITVAGSISPLSIAAFQSRSASTGVFGLVLVVIRAPAGGGFFGSPLAICRPSGFGRSIAVLSSFLSGRPGVDRWNRDRPKMTSDRVVRLYIILFRRAASTWGPSAAVSSVFVPARSCLPRKLTSGSQ